MKKSTVIYLLGAVLAGGLVATAPVHADRGHEHRDFHRGRHHMVRSHDGDAYVERLARRLDLTSEQLASVRAIVDEMRPQVREFKDRLREGRKQLRTLIKEGTFDEAEVRSIAQAQGATTADLIVLRTTMKSDIRNVLTEEQREQLNRRRGKRGHRS